MKKRIIFGLLLLSLLLVLAVTADATVATKPINVAYQDIKLFVNGNAITLQPDEEPFIFNGRTFVPIRFVSEALGQNVEWIDWIKAVKITGGANANSLAEKDKEIQALKAEIANLKDELDYEDEEDIEDEEDEDSDLSDLEDQLMSDYDSLEDVEIDDIRLDGDEDDVDVDIYVDLDEYDSEWEDLSNSDIEDWLEDLVSDIQDEFSDDTVVNGRIIDNDSDDVLVEFDKDGDEDLDVEFNDEDYREGSSDSGDEDDAIDSLEDGNYYVGSIEFSMTVSYDEDDDTATAKLTAEDDDAASEWDDLSDSSIEDDVIDICDDIANTFDDDADISLNTIKVRFYDEDAALLKSYSYDVEDEELD
jgi:hypothetical protein